MASYLKKLLNRREQPSLLDQPQPGDGIGYPVPYTGERLKVDHEFLKKCKTLRSSSGAYRLNETTVIKTGEAVRMAEAAAMRIVAEHTSIPVPKVLDAYMQDGDDTGVLIMEYVTGETLDRAWRRCDEAQKQHLTSQLHGYLCELRAFPIEKLGNIGRRIGALDGSSCWDQFFPLDESFGPYQSVTDFHDALAVILTARHDDSWSRMVGTFLVSLDDCGLALTHNDITPRNILVREGNIVAILDWELCGVFPDYWEYVKTRLWESWNSDLINERVPEKVLEPRLKKLAYLLHARDILR